MPPPPHFVPFHDLLLVEAVRAVEADTPLEDTVAMRAAIEGAAGREERIVLRARALADSLGLQADIDGVRRAANGLALLLLLAGALLASSMVAGMLGEGRTLNAAAALGLALLPNLVGLPVWIVAVLVARGGEGLLGRALRQTARLGWLRGRAPQVLAAASRVLDRHRLTAWAWGGANHALWAVAYVMVLMAMVFAFGMRAYRLGWETTILPPGFFDGLYRLVAWGQGRLHGSGAAGGDAVSAALAWWLIGGVAVYGLGLRVAVLVVCWGRWRYARRRLAIDLSDPYFRRLLNRFDALAPPRIVDAERRMAPAGRGERGTATMASSADLAVVAFELPPEAEVPAGVRAAAAWIERIDGTRDERDAVLHRLAERRPGRLLLVCHAGSTPDRGTQRFLAAARAPSTAVLLAPATGRTALAPAQARWRAWLDDSGLADVPALADELAALAWLKDSDG